MPTTPSRLFLYSSDIMKITGLSHCAAIRTGTQIRKHFKRLPRSRLIINDFCTYTGLTERQILPFLK